MKCTQLTQIYFNPNHRLFILSSMICAAVILSSVNLYAQPIEQKVTANKTLKQISDLSLLPPQLDFAQFLARQSQKKSFDIVYLKSLKNNLNQENSIISVNSLCDKIAFQTADTTLNLAIERQELFTGIESEMYHGRIGQLAQGKDIYLHWLKSWLMTDITPEQLQHIALTELSKVKQLRAEHTLNQSSSQPKIFLGGQHKEILKAFTTREILVKKKLNALFNFTGDVAPYQIERSTLPDSFPAPGIYNTQNQTFIYHLTNNQLPEHHMDWLYLHEAIPGHHFQFDTQAEKGLCYESPYSITFSEGWGAYVETLGHQLGLYQDAESFHYALDWRALRALRVLLDIGIHYLDWPDSKARAVWQQYIPEQSDIMAREIARIKRWPVQVITYVYGKDQIEQQLKTLANQYPQATIRRAMLALSNQPIFAMQYLNDAIKSQQLEGAE